MRDKRALFVTEILSSCQKNRPYLCYISEMKEYTHLCLAGESTIPERKTILAIKRDALLEQLKQVQDCIDYIDWKQSFYDDVLSGKTKYYSNLIHTDNNV